MKAYTNKNGHLRLSLTEVETELLIEALFDWCSHQQMHDKVDDTFSDVYVFCQKILAEIKRSRKSAEIVKQLQKMRQRLNDKRK